MATIINRRTLISKSNSLILGVAGGAAFVVVFCLVASKSLLSQELYQNRVINAQQNAINQVNSDVSAANQLSSSYQTFVLKNPNIIGGSSTGDTGQNGNNAKIILDALPSTYDFPGLTTSLQAIINLAGVQLTSLTGTDNSSSASTQPSGTPSPISIPFTVAVTGSYTQIQTFIGYLQDSIRPIQIQTIQISGSQGSISASITAQTYYQPGKALNFSEVTVK